ncbi:MAG: ABC transporter ATP-binding protein [Azovibrio sp.]|nr:ABC transporter ATP-binding protein [Azovibrio sp.]
MKLEARHLAFAYRQRLVLDGISLSLKPGQVVSLLGSNGAGKSTLLRLLLGLLQPARGELLRDGKPLEQWPRRQLARQLAYVPQIHSTPFPYTVTEVVLLGRLPAGSLFRSPSREDREIAAAALEQVGIPHLAERPYTEISGGERQLALIARALAQGARLLIMDEPATGLDYGHQLRLLERLGQLAAAGYGVLMSTHHPEHALLASTRVLLLENGRIRAAGPPEQVLNPANLQALYDIPPGLLQRAMSCWQPAGPSSLSPPTKESFHVPEPHPRLPA